MIGVAAIGAGNWGRNIVRSLASLPEATLKHVCDLSETTRKSIKALYPEANVTDDDAGLLADPDVKAVFIAVDAPRHHPVAKAALQAGKHVFVEKPLALKADDCRELIDLAQAKGVKLQVGHLLEYHPAVTYLKEMLQDGHVGHPLYLYFQRVNLGVIRSAENAWWSLAPHDVSVACYLFDATPVSVTATGHDYLQNGVEDVVFACLKFADGKMAHVHVSWLDPHKIRKITLVGSEKMVVFDDMEAAEKIRIYDKAAMVDPTVDSYADAITLRTGDILIPKVSTAEPLKAECQHFIDCIKNDTVPRSDGADGLRVVQVLEAGSESLAMGGAPVAIA